MARCAACLLLLAPLAAAEIITVADDGLGDDDAVSAVQHDTKVEAFRRELDAVKAKLLMLKRRDLLAMFGQPAQQHEGFERFGQPKERHALPVAQPRCMALPGRRYREEEKNKDRIDFYGCGLEVYYGISGESPCAVVFWLPVDANLPRLGPNNLAARLHWDRTKWNDLVAGIEKQWAAAFPWVVDRDAEAKFYEGERSTDPAEKLAAWKALGEKLGYRHEEREEGGCRHSCWYRPDKTRAFECVMAEYGPTFTWYDASGWNELRREWGSARAFPTWWRWYRPGGSSQIRAEGSDGSPEKRPTEWLWWDKADRLVRYEQDDNGDGIPDAFDGKLPADGDHEEEWQPLDLDRSWAVHPELIPEECRIPDQPDRRVPVLKAK